jgi:hypothetical protein
MIEKSPEQIHNEWKAWIESRPPEIQELAKRFPPGFSFEKDGTTLHLLGYHEGGTGQSSLIVSKIDPAKDWHGANENKQYICADHLDEISA